MDNNIHYGMETRSEPMYEGETIPDFAKRFGLTFDELIRLNPDKKPPKMRIYFGQHLSVPLNAVDMEKENG